jgi:hypothetical protein
MSRRAPLPHLRKAWNSIASFPRFLEKIMRKLDPSAWLCNYFFEIFVKFFCMQNVKILVIKFWIMNLIFNRTPLSEHLPNKRKFAGQIKSEITKTFLLKVKKTIAIFSTFFILNIFAHICKHIDWPTEI